MHGKAQARKDRLIADLTEARRFILDTVSALSPAQQDEVFLGAWSVKDLLAHLVGWDYANLEAIQAVRAGRRPAYWAHYDRDWKTFNAHLVATYRREEMADLLAEIALSHRQLIDAVEAVPAEELYLEQGQESVAAILRVEVRDEREHGRQIREFAVRRDLQGD
jgi:hypothetical protein